MKIVEVIEQFGVVTLSKGDDGSFAVGILHRPGMELHQEDPYVDFLITKDEKAARLLFNKHKGTQS